MGRKEKLAYLRVIRPRYKTADRRTKARILDEFCAVCGYNRKYATRLLNAQPKRGKTKRGKKPKYTGQLFMQVLQAIYKASDFMCSDRLKAAIPVWLPHYEQTHKPVDDDTRTLLLSVSPATIDRLLSPIRARVGKGLCGTRPGTLLRSQIPVRTANWDINSPGYMEADTVAHCGNSLAGEFVWSLTMTDIHSQWTECRAVWNKAADGVLAQIRDIERGLPFELLGFDCDNGSEFINHNLVNFFKNRPKPVHFTRSRPYKKNDNAHVEQKNWTHPRHLLGYYRIDDMTLVDLINDLYANEWSLLQNHFCPSLKLIEKVKFGSKFHKIYDKPITPYQRILYSDKISQENKAILTLLHNRLNPFKLKKSIEAKLNNIFKLIRVTFILRQRI
jgi:hypothetical protein